MRRIDQLNMRCDNDLMEPLCIPKEDTGSKKRKRFGDPCVEIRLGDSRIPRDSRLWYFVLELTWYKFYGPFWYATQSCLGLTLQAHRTELRRLTPLYLDRQKNLSHKA